MSIRVYHFCHFFIYFVYFVEIAGDIHFDDSEDFTESGYNGKSLPWTALHEIGHSLGLMHSENWGAVMSSEYASFSHPNQPLALTADDINGVQSLYGTYITIVYYSLVIRGVIGERI